MDALRMALMLFSPPDTALIRCLQLDLDTTKERAPRYGNLLAPHQRPLFPPRTAEAPPSSLCRTLFLRTW
ncbi:hypothetical protein MUK42_05542 [Musa troglodytarum]|uniref:Uncharacterized protein n=1 Tax=Musa troglodytarum TaxID=320322 RepID=A0A9E7EPC5_9LILI|nr:hypothetical protein MUK42_05542 [Musa troglodytarum]